MDIMLGTTIINPSGLDASAIGNPSLVRGVSGRAVELDTPAQYMKVSGPGHRYECFGDLDLCNLGELKLLNSLRWFLTNVHCDQWNSFTSMIIEIKIACVICQTRQLSREKQNFHSGFEPQSQRPNTEIAFYVFWKVVTCDHMNEHLSGLTD